MKTTMLSKFGYCASLIVVFIAIIRWYFIYPDISQLAFGLNIALTIILCSYVHSGFRNVVNDLREPNKVRDEEIAGLSRALDREIKYTQELGEKVDKLIEHK